MIECVGASVTPETSRSMISSVRVPSWSQWPDNFSTRNGEMAASESKGQPKKRTRRTWMLLTLIDGWQERQRQWDSSHDSDLSGRVERSQIPTISRPDCRLQSPGSAHWPDFSDCLRPSYNSMVSILFFPCWCQCCIFQWQLVPWMKQSAVGSINSILWLLFLSSGDMHSKEPHVHPAPGRHLSADPAGRVDLGWHLPLGTYHLLLKSWWSSDRLGGVTLGSITPAPGVSISRVLNDGTATCP